MLCSRQILFASLLVVIIVSQSQGYPNGQGITSACSSLIPGHGVSEQKTLSPYKIVFNPPSYKPGSPVTVTVITCQRPGFKGFLIQARRADKSLNQNEALGSFSAITNTRQTCSGNTALSHAESSTKMSLTFNWNPPLTPQGHIVFRATFVRDDSRFWTVTSNVLNDASITTSETSSSLTTATPLDGSCSVNNSNPGVTDNSISTNSAGGQTTQLTQARSLVKDTACGITKGCFSNCHGTVCSFIISWSQEGNYGVYTLNADVGSKTGTYLALGFSTDDKMGDDSVTGCASRNDGSVVLFNGRNTGKSHPTLFIDKNVTLLNHTNADGIFFCTFKRLIAASTDGRVDISQPWVLLFAQGLASVSSNDDVRLQYHGSVNRYVSQTTYKVADIIDSEAKILKFPLIRAHGSLMIAAWIFFSSVGIVVARYYKEAWKGLMFSQKVWFQIHRTCMVLVLSTTVAGFIIIFVEVKGWSKFDEDDGYLKAHPIMGVIVTALTVLNPLMAMFRPHPGTPNRPIFNWAHWFVGMTAHSLGVINIFFGIKMSKTNVPEYLIYVLATYVAWQIFVMLLLELITCFGRKKDRRDLYELHTEGDKNFDANLPFMENSVLTLAKQIIFVAHAIVVGVLSISVIVILSVD
uniref:Ferric-chelate reductase 1 n=1 Tax=Arion vulgaris TaxID=1028688 RepID=A0A0B7ARA4_9EUPU